MWHLPEWAKLACYIDLFTARAKSCKVKSIAILSQSHSNYWTWRRLSWLNKDILIALRSSAASVFYLVLLSSERDTPSLWNLWHLDIEIFLIFLFRIEKGYDSTIGLQLRLCAHAHVSRYFGVLWHSSLNVMNRHRLIVWVYIVVYNTWPSNGVKDHEVSEVSEVLVSLESRLSQFPTMWPKLFDFDLPDLPDLPHEKWSDKDTIPFFIRRHLKRVVFWKTNPTGSSHWLREWPVKLAASQLHFFRHEWDKSNCLQ